MNSYIIEIPSSLLNEMLCIASKSDDEVCGVLIGKQYDDHTYKITHMIPDLGALYSSPISVTRNTKKLYPLIKNIVENSEIKGIDYIGDWHSHPNYYCRYSSIDCSTMKELINDNNYDFLDGIILMIIKPPDSTTAYLFLRKNNMISEMRILKI